MKKIAIIKITLACMMLCGCCACEKGATTGPGPDLAGTLSLIEDYHIAAAEGEYNKTPLRNLDSKNSLVTFKRKSNFYARIECRIIFEENDFDVYIESFPLSGGILNVDFYSSTAVTEVAVNGSNSVSVVATISGWIRDKSLIEPEDNKPYDSYNMRPEVLCSIDVTMNIEGKPLKVKITSIGA